MLGRSTTRASRAHASNADRIAVLEEGRITGSGSHDELLSRDSWYARAPLRCQGHPDALVVS